MRRKKAEFAVWRVAGMLKCGGFGVIEQDLEIPHPVRLHQDI
jgi:hypothetical protein